MHLQTAEQQIENGTDLLVTKIDDTVFEVDVEHSLANPIDDLARAERRWQPFLS